MSADFSLSFIQKRERRKNCDREAAGESWALSSSSCSLSLSLDPASKRNKRLDPTELLLRQKRRRDAVFSFLFHFCFFLRSLSSRGKEKTWRKFSFPPTFPISFALLPLYNALLIRAQKNKRGERYEANSPRELGGETPGRPDPGWSSRDHIIRQYGLQSTYVVYLPSPSAFLWDIGRLCVRAGEAIASAFARGKRGSSSALPVHCSTFVWRTPPAASCMIKRRGSRLRPIYRHY